MKGVLQKIGSLRTTGRGPSADGGGDPGQQRGSSVTLSIIDQHVARLKQAEEARKAREALLTGLKPFVLDNTLVECLASGSETLEDKLEALSCTRACGLQNVVLAAFVKERTPDLPFLQALHSSKLIDEHCFAFSELYDAHGSDLPGQDLPFGLAKMIQYGIQNAILEVDVAAPYINWDKYHIEDLCALVESRCRWVASNLYAGRPTQPASYVHLRDFSAAMQSAPARLLTLVEALARLDPAVRPRGLLINQPAAGQFPFEAAPCVAAVRGVMDAAGWSEGLLAVHVGSAPGYGLAHATVLECLAAGCGGVMAALCEEADPASSHASSMLDLVNLARLGNKHVGERFHMDRLRAAAKQVSAIMARAKAAAAAAPQTAAAGGSAGTQRGAAMTAVEPPTGSPAKTLPRAIPADQRKLLIPGHA
ncbi:hypothetical protein CHLRE_11g467531v5 [Chlamydomonas reinhardtii]|uniref:Flagellar associated protein n=1 Tax=Chlamydomonas reinhardtii TaxID=3055 RepID=A0A2K3D764_CHLRE|nr:uncharacterized protein CHLRE_11g467531v5 [Chlamydomonas reinhardtii]PNW76373.1 hypothetical protein CHLRE_11g467531v5 [Chlamydomonas reinhardtii]